MGECKNYSEKHISAGMVTALQGWHKKHPEMLDDATNAEFVKRHFLRRGTDLLLRGGDTEIGAGLLQHWPHACWKSRADERPVSRIG